MKEMLVLSQSKCIHIKLTVGKPSVVSKSSMTDTKYRIKITFAIFTPRFNVFIDLLSSIPMFKCNQFVLKFLVRDKSLCSF